jgi:hypothetical protein
VPPFFEKPLSPFPMAISRDESTDPILDRPAIPATPLPIVSTNDEPVKSDLGPVKIPCSSVPFLHAERPPPPAGPHPGSCTHGPAKATGLDTAACPPLGRYPGPDPAPPEAAIRNNVQNKVVAILVAGTVRGSGCKGRGILVAPLPSLTGSRSDSILRSSECHPCCKFPFPLKLNKGVWCVLRTWSGQSSQQKR